MLTEARLLTVDEGTVEVAHEALLSEWPRLRGWLEADAEGRRLHQHLIGAAREWRDSERDPAELYRGARLAAALDWAAEHDPELNELERAFLDESRAASEREAERQRRAVRRLRTLLAGVGVLLAAAVVAGVIAISERGSARSAATAPTPNGSAPRPSTRTPRPGAAARQRRRRPRRLDRHPQQPALVLLRNPQRCSACWAAPGMRRSTRRRSAPTDACWRSATPPAPSRSSTLESPRLGGYQLGAGPGGGLVQTLTFSPDGRTLAVTGQEPPNEPPGALVDLIDPRTQERRVRIVLPPFPDPSVYTIASLAFLPGGRDLVVLQNSNHHRACCEGSTRRRARSRDAPASRSRRGHRSVRRPTDRGHVFVTSAHDDETREIDARTLRVVRRYPVGDAAGALSPDGSAFALGSSEARSACVDLRSGRVRRFRGRHEAASSGLRSRPTGGRS